MERERTVLVVDDESDIRDTVAALFEMYGWKTIQGENGEQAVSMAIEHLPDLVVLDVMMPVMGGIEAFKELREDSRTNHMPVVMLTAVNEYELSVHRDAEVIGHETHVAPPQAFIEKPVDAKALCDALTEIFGEW